MSDRPLVAEKFLNWISDVIQRLGPDILRTKGVLAMRGDDDRFVIQAVHMLMEEGTSGLGRTPNNVKAGWYSSAAICRRMSYARDLKRAGLERDGHARESECRSERSRPPQNVCSASVPQTGACLPQC